MKKLPLASLHADLGAKFGEFAGFSMPLYYSRPVAEHNAVRNSVGLFDISHMGQFLLEGRQVLPFLQYLLANDVGGMDDGAALYSPICREDGGVLDDLIVYRYAPSRFRMVVNAGTREKDFDWLSGHAGRFGVELRDISAEWGLVAVQGPEAFERLTPHIEFSLGGLGYYRFVETRAFGLPVFLARTGYTGEPGCELAVTIDRLEALWRGLTEKLEIMPIGLAARDTLRLEACMALYGHELREEWHPFESGLGWAVKLDIEADFIGKAALKKIKAERSPFLLAGLELRGRGIPRADYPVMAGEQTVGIVTSGGLSTTTGKAVALAHIEAAYAKRGTELSIEIRGNRVEALVVPRPFYRNPRLRD